MNNIQSSIESVQLEWFRLDQEGNSEDPKRFLKGMEALLNLEDLSSKQPGLVEYAFEQISSAKFKDSETVEKVKEISKQLLGKWMKISMGGHSRYILRSHLAKNVGSKFQQQFSHQLKDVKGKELHLDLPEDSPFTIPPNVAESFLMYLQTGIVTIEDEDLLTLLLLARLHCVTSLIEECRSLLKKQLSWENLGVILEFAVEQQLSRLLGECLIFVQHHSNKKPEGFQCHQMAPITLALSLMNKGILLSTTPSGLMQVELIEPTVDDSMALLNEVNDLTPLTSLIIDQFCTVEPLPLLKEIAHSLPNLEELIIWNPAHQNQDLSTLRTLFPKLRGFGNDVPFLKTCEELEAYINNFATPPRPDGTEEIATTSEKLQLRSLNLQAIPNISNTQFCELTDYISHLYHISIHSNEISHIDAPLATTIRCSECTALTKLLAPKATWIDCRGCSALTELQAPFATLIFRSGCPALTELQAQDKQTKAHPYK